MAAAYGDLRWGGPERGERVRRIAEAYLVPHFAPRTTTVADVTYRHCHDWLLGLVGRDQPARPGVTRFITSDGDEEMGLAELATVAGISLPTTRRRWRAGTLPSYHPKDPLGPEQPPPCSGR